MRRKIAITCMLLLAGCGAVWFNTEIQDWFGLVAAGWSTGFELAIVKTFPDAPGKLFVPNGAIKTDQPGYGEIYVVRDAKDRAVRVVIGEVRGEWTEIKSEEVQPSDKVIQFTK